MQQDLKLFDELVDLLFSEEKQNPVATPIKPSKLYESMDFSLNEKPSIDDHFKTTLTQLIKSTPKTASKSFFNQLFGQFISR